MSGCMAHGWHMEVSPSRTGETREEWLSRAIELMRPEFEAAGAPLPERLAVSCIWPSENPQTMIGECWVAEASSRGSVEVFISPGPRPGRRRPGRARHPAARAGTRGRSPRPRQGVQGAGGGAGPERADDGNDRQPRAARLHQLDRAAPAGLLPTRRHHRARRDRGSADRARRQADHPAPRRPAKKQSTRMLKAECPECGYTIRLAKKWADIGLPSCPSDDAGLQLTGPGEGAEGEGLQALPVAAVRG